MRNELKTWRKGKPTIPTHDVDSPSTAPTSSATASAPQRRPVPLRRWSVAELLARALPPAPPTQAIDH
jgi:hypothetical protein